MEDVADLKLTKYQKFEIVTISRDTINYAYYNPRKISDAAKKKLKDKLKKLGLVQPLIFNKRTGNLVAGHQLLEIIDQLEKSKQYLITVAEIDVDEEKEVDLNIFLNNQSAMGEWDTNKLQEINTIFPNLDFINDLGFDKIDIEYLNFTENTDIKFNEIDNKNIDPEKYSDNLTKLKQAKKDFKNAKKEEHEVAEGDYFSEYNDYTISFVFNNNKDKQDFCEKIKQPRKEKFLKYTVLHDLATGKYKNDLLL